MCTITENVCTDKNAADQDLTLKIPKLPDGKTKHFFVSYNSLDKQRVFAIVDEVEKRFGLQCVFDERDFQGGKDISVNIREGMMNSLKVLLFLTPNFLQSGWCKYETDAAFVLSMGCGYSCIVPVLLEECEIPPTLVTLTYIDATITGIDVPEKIASALLRHATDDGLFPLSIRTWNKIHENGYCYIIPAKRDNLWSYRPAKYRFAVDSNLIEKLRENRVEVPEELLQETVDILNRDSIMWSYDYLSRCRNFMWTFLLIPLYILIFCLAKISWILDVATRGREQELWSYQISFLMYIFMPVSFVAIQIPLCLIPNICYRKKREVSLQAKLWRKVGKQCIENNVLLLFTGRRNKKPTLHVMRYDIARCKEYFVGIIKARNLTPADRTLTPETYADILIERHLSEISSTLADDFDFLPDAPYNRHNVKKGKMCICQYLENNL
ncbi:uncharacterized protein LOC123536364 [Mercenaria mercenaria]|uniref:uncharacterized protein LOC123536364 n=1 Tax=Mercenaria mercenaria TaxID=6596 RepID=UPI00234EA23F|nr:uncharacterized protein LOC123536364 [Mercenaria mercenaria]XP_053384637.1 uncharacterized protein LOC123536364 [Mercenaria mercenaria]